MLQVITAAPGATMYAGDRSHPAAFLAHHPVFAGISVAGAASAGGFFIGRAIAAPTPLRRAGGLALGSFEFSIAATLIRTIISIRRRDAAQHMIEGDPAKS